MNIPFPSKIDKFITLTNFSNKLIFYTPLAIRNEGEEKFVARAYYVYRRATNFFSSSFGLKIMSSHSGFGFKETQRESRESLQGNGTIGKKSAFMKKTHKGKTVNWPTSSSRLSALLINRRLETKMRKFRKMINYITAQLLPSPAFSPMTEEVQQLRNFYFAQLLLNFLGVV